MKNYLLSPASDTGLEVQHNLLRLVKSPSIRQKSLQYTSHAAHSSHCQVRRSIWLEVEGTQHAVNSTLLLLLLIPLSVPLLLPIVNPAGRGWLVSGHSCCKFFPKVVEALVVAGQSDVLPDGLWVEALAEMELSIGDQGEVGAKIIAGNPVELAYHRCKWGSSPDLVILGVLELNLFSLNLTDCSRTPNSCVASSDKKFSLMSAPEGFTGNWCKPTTWGTVMIWQSVYFVLCSDNSSYFFQY